MIVYTCQLEGKGDRLTELLQQAAHVGLNGVEALNLLIVVHEHVAVDLVDEHLVPDVRLDLASALDHLEKLLASALVVCVVRIDHVY